MIQKTQQLLSCSVVPRPPHRHDPCEQESKPFTSYSTEARQIPAGELYGAGCSITTSHVLRGGKEKAQGVSEFVFEVVEGCEHCKLFSAIG